MHSALRQRRVTRCRPLVVHRPLDALAAHLAPEPRAEVRGDPPAGDAEGQRIDPGDQSVPCAPAGKLVRDSPWLHPLDGWTIHRCAGAAYSSADASSHGGFEVVGTA